MIQAAVKNSNLRPANLYDFGYHYSRTLREWRLRFLENEEKLKNSDIMIIFAEHGFIIFATVRLGLRRIYRGYTPPFSQAGMYAWTRIYRMSSRLSFFTDLVIFQIAWFACVLASVSPFSILIPILGTLLVIIRCLVKKALNKVSHLPLPA